MLNLNFYDQCTKEVGSLVSTEVQELAGNCLEDRRCSNGEGTSLDASNQYFVGFRNETECNTSNQCTNDDIGLGQNALNLASQRYKRKIGGRNQFSNQVQKFLPNTKKPLSFVLAPLNPNGTKQLATAQVTKVDGVDINRIQQEIRNQSNQQDKAACRLGTESTATGANTKTNQCLA